jgi:hypothetical protein
MRVSNHRARKVLALALAAGLSSVAVACGSPPAASGVPASDAAATPVVTPDPHLAEPATADQVFNAIRHGSLPLSVNNATAGGPNSPLIKQINAQVANWPLVISEYRTSSQLRELISWEPGTGPRQGDPPYTWVGMNIVVKFGPTTGIPAAPDAMRQEQAKALIGLIDPLLWPLEQRSMAPVPIKTAPPGAAAPAVSPPSAAPASAAP